MAHPLAGCQAEDDIQVLLAAVHAERNLAGGAVADMTEALRQVGTGGCMGGGEGGGHMVAIPLADMKQR
jgi:hypothetical protein